MNVFVIRYSTPSPLTSTISWYKNGHELPNAKVFRWMWTILFLNTQVLTKDLHLVLTGVRASDSGRYFCRVTSEVGSVQSREAGLRVEDKQQAPEISHRLEEWPIRGPLSCHVTCIDQSGPFIITTHLIHRPLMSRVVRGQRIVLDCLASGYPPPTYSWYKDGGRLSSAHDRWYDWLVWKHL